MDRWIVSGAAGVVIGIITHRFHEFPASLTPSCLIAGLILLAFSIFLMASGKSAWILSFMAFTFIGIAVTARHLDTSAPGHLNAVLKTIENVRSVNIEGTIVQPPDIRELYTIVALKIIRMADSADVPVTVRRGLVYVKIYPAAGDIRQSVEYGDRILLRSIRLQAPAPSSNPGSFDMQAFLNNQGFYATAVIREKHQIERLESGSGNPLIHLSEAVKNRLLITIKQTLPFPESSFLGGVLLGLRSGLSDEIKNEFRAAGVSHVLAVSGLHVTIITLFFIGIFKLLRLPRTSSFIVIICALILFTLITGARPSAVRAAIMNGVTLLFFYFRGIKLDRSFLLGIAIAALFILLRNPLLLTEASFLFSFSAVLSLATLTRPIQRFCNAWLRGFFRTFLFFEAMIAAGMLFVVPLRSFVQSRVFLAGLLLIGAAALADRLLPVRLEFRRWPSWLSTFFSAQLAIQLGMLPLTALFFKKISVSAPMANFVAIPLIGVIVQLGLFAGILGIIPVVGQYLALCLNASNWLCIKLFLSTASFFGTRFPFPDISPPGPKFLIAYYLLLILFAGWPQIRSALAPRSRYILANLLRPHIYLRLIGLSIPAVFLISQSIPLFKQAYPRCTVTILEPSVFAKGGGNAIIIETPDDRHFLIDAGPQYVLQQNQPVVVDIGRRIVIPALLELHARQLDGIILTSADDRNAGGIASVLENPWIQTTGFYHALPFDALDGNSSSDDILKLLGDPELFQGSYRRRSELTAWALRDIFAAAGSRKIPMHSIRDGTVIHEASIAVGDIGKSFRIQVLNPPEKPYSGSFSTRSNSVVIRIEYGAVSMILTSNAGKSVQAEILNRHSLEAQVVQLASNGAEYAFNPDFVAGARVAVAALSPSPWAQKDTARTREMVQGMGIEFLSTTSGGAVSISTDGVVLDVKRHNDSKWRSLAP